MIDYVVSNRLRLIPGDFLTLRCAKTASWLHQIPDDHNADDFVIEAADPRRWDETLIFTIARIPLAAAIAITVSLPLLSTIYALMSAYSSD